MICKHTTRNNFDVLKLHHSIAQLQVRTPLCKCNATANEHNRVKLNHKSTTLRPPSNKIMIWRIIKKTKWKRHTVLVEHRYQIPKSIDSMRPALQAASTDIERFFGRQGGGFTLFGRYWISLFGDTTYCATTHAMPYSIFDPSGSVVFLFLSSLFPSLSWLFHRPHHPPHFYHNRVASHFHLGSQYPDSHSRPHVCPESDPTSDSESDPTSDSPSGTSKSFALDRQIQIAMVLF